MDTLDRLILNELSYRCRVSFTELAEKFDVSLSTIKNRVEALVEEGVILNFVVQLPLRIVQGSIAIISLEIESTTQQSDLITLGEHPFIMAMGVGYELQGFAIAVYRTNDELSQAIHYLQSSELVTKAHAYPVVTPPNPVDMSQSKGLDALKKVDWKILKSMQWDGRKTLGDIAEEVGASVPTVRKRIAFMRKHTLIEESIHINPAATENRLVVMLLVRSPLNISLDYYAMDGLLREKFGEKYWISFGLANQPEIMLSFVVSSSREVAEIRSDLASLAEGTDVYHQMIVPEWIYFPDFRHEIVENNQQA